jgi:hypothetical protein
LRKVLDLKDLSIRKPEVLQVKPKNLRFSVLLNPKSWVYPGIAPDLARIKAGFEHEAYQGEIEPMQDSPPSSQPKISGLLKGRFRGISEQRLLQRLTRLGKDVQIVVKPAARRNIGGSICVKKSAFPLQNTAGTEAQLRMGR